METGVEASGGVAFAPASADWEQRVRASFDRQAFMSTLGARVARVALGEVEIVADHDPRLTQQHGYLHAGVTAALADTASGYAAFTLAADDQTVLTVEYKINLVAPGVGERFRALGRVVAAGRRIKTVVATVHAESAGRPPLLVAQVQATMMTPRGSDDPAPGRA